MITSVNSLNPSVYAPVFENSASGAGKLFVPVRPAMVMYAQFDHVAGVPASTGSGVSISKIQILNALIDRLISVKARSEIPEIADEEGMDGMIQQYQAALHETLGQAQSNPFLLPGSAFPPGQLFSIRV
jgi:hypothetical protein